MDRGQFFNKGRKTIKIKTNINRVYYGRMNDYKTANEIKIFRNFARRVSLEIRLGRYAEASIDCGKMAGILRTWNDLSLQNRKDNNFPKNYPRVNGGEWKEIKEKIRNLKKVGKA